jgi:hypothetical protein
LSGVAAHGWPIKPARGGRPPLSPSCDRNTKSAASAIIANAAVIEIACQRIRHYVPSCRIAQSSLREALTRGARNSCLVPFEDGCKAQSSRRPAAGLRSVNQIIIRNAPTAMLRLLVGLDYCNVRVSTLVMGKLCAHLFYSPIIDFRGYEGISLIGPGKTSMWTHPVCPS